MTSGSLSIEILTKILLGTTLWLYGANTILASVHHLSTSAHLITKVYFPRALLVLAPAVAQLLDLVLMSVLIFIAAAISGLLHGQLYLLAFPYVGVMLYILGPALITSGLAARFRDIKHIAPYFLQLWFFCTPNIYVPDFTPQGVSTIIMAILNPLNYWVMAAQHILSKENVQVTLWTMAAVSSLLWCLVGVWIFMRLERTLADHI
jgi:lipopolysaccharide transport system permease protein